MRFNRVLAALGGLVAIGALAFACAPFTESRDGAPPVDARRSDDPTVPALPLRAPLDAGTASADGGGVTSADVGASVDASQAMLCAGTADCERVVFVTSETIYGGLIGGIAGGDLICNGLARASSHPRVAGRSFKAWLSDDASSPSTTFVHGTKAYVRPDGRRIAADYGELTSGKALENAIELDEDGRLQSGSVWSATSASGHHDGATCNGWQSASAPSVGAQGLIGVKAQRWTWDYGTDLGSGVESSDCMGADFHIYCFEE